MSPYLHNPEGQFFRAPLLLSINSDMQISRFRANQANLILASVFGFNEQRLYILTGSQCIGGRGLLIFESEKCEDLMNQMICMMRSIAGESDSPTETTSSPQISQRNSKSPQPLLKSNSGSTLRNAPPTQTKKSMQDLSASLQDFCRAHCCSLPPLRGRSETQSAEAVGEIDQETLVGSQAQGLGTSRGGSDDNLSLDEDHGDHHQEDEEELSIAREMAENVCTNLNGHENNSPTNDDHPKGSRKRTLRTSSLKKSISEFIAHSMARMESLKPPPPPPPIPTNQTSDANSPQSGDRFPPPPVPLMGDLRAQSLTETHKVGENNGEEPSFPKEERHSRRAESAKAVQLIKWRDLPGKEDYYGATNNRLMLGRLDRNSESERRGSDLVQWTGDQQFTESQHTESSSMQEENSLQSSTSTARERQLSAALKSDMIAFTSNTAERVVATLIPFLDGKLGTMSEKLSRSILGSNAALRKAMPIDVTILGVQTFIQSAVGQKLPNDLIFVDPR
ncbi:hypothetical protein ACTXT7_016781, partial [Hymenolepis weldensis]